MVAEQGEVQVLGLPVVDVKTQFLEQFQQAVQARHPFAIVGLLQQRLHARGYESLGDEAERVVLAA